MDDSKGLWSSIEGLIQQGVSAFQSYATLKSQQSTTAATLQSQVEIQKAESKKLLYFGIGMIGFLILWRTMRANA